MTRTQRMTLDAALDAFEKAQTNEAAASLMTVAMTYWHDDMIGDMTFDAIMLQVRDYLMIGAVPDDDMERRRVARIAKAVRNGVRMSKAIRDEAIK